MATLKLTISPKNATSKKIQWTSSKKSVLLASGTGASCKISGRKTGTSTVTAKAMDGSGKLAKVKVKVTEFQREPTPTPVIEKDPRKFQTVEDFEGYAPGTKWGRFTAGGYTDSGSMTVVEDPENPKNKVLKIEYNGQQQSYDFAPVFELAVPDGRPLKDVTAIRLKSRMIANTAECNYKKAYCFFDAAGAVTAADYFATSNYEGTAPKEVPDRKNRFGVNIPMAEGDDKNYNIPEAVEAGNAVQDKDMVELSKGRKYNNKNLPTYFSEYETGDKEAVSPGYSENETTAENRVGFQQNTLNLINEKIAAANITGDDQTPLLDRNRVDMVLGSTYSGSQGKPYNEVHMTLYLDDIQITFDGLACESMKFADPPAKVACGNPQRHVEPGRASLELSYTPSNTSQREVTYTCSDPSLATVDENGTLTANNEGRTGKVTVTATNKANPAITASTDIEIVWVEPASSDYDVLGTSVVLPKGEASAAMKVVSNTDTFKLENGVLTGTFDDKDVSIVLDLGREVDVSAYRGIEVRGVTPGSVALEFYGSGFDMTQTKDDGADKDWWETASGKTYPFYIGSCGWRYEKGGMNYLKAVANGATKWSDTKVSPTEEAQRFSLNKLAQDCTGDWSRIRYIVVKSNKGPNLSEKGAFDKGNVTENRTPFTYQIKGLKFLAEGVVDASDEGHYIIDTKTPAETSGDVKSYYVDSVTADKPADKRDTAMNLSDFKYICVKVKDTKNVKAGIVADGKTLADAVAIGEETGDGERSVYFRIDTEANRELLKAVDAISVEVDAGGTVTGLSGTKGEIGQEEGITKVDVVPAGDGTYTVTPVTLEAYGTEKPAA